MKYVVVFQRKILKIHISWIYITENYLVVQTWPHGGKKVVEVFTNWFISEVGQKSPKLSKSSKMVKSLPTSPKLADSEIGIVIIPFLWTFSIWNCNVCRSCRFNKFMLSKFAFELFTTIVNGMKYLCVPGVEFHYSPSADSATTGEICFRWLMSGVQSRMTTKNLSALFNKMIYCGAAGKIILISSYFRKKMERNTSYPVL